MISAKCLGNLRQWSVHMHENYMDRLVLELLFGVLAGKDKQMPKQSNSVKIATNGKVKREK